MDEEIKEKFLRYNAEVAQGFDNLPIVTRLEFISNVLCNRAGRASDPHYDPALLTLVEILEGTMDILRTVPNIDRLRLAEPREP